MKNKVLIIAIIIGLLIFLLVCLKFEQLDQSGRLILPEGELKVEDIKIGEGVTAETGETLSVLYTGKLIDGTVFDSNQDRENPFKFTLGAGEVIKGWDQGLIGMKTGGIRKLTIPPALAYGNKATGSIPANSWLVFEIELLGVSDNAN